MSGSYSHDEEKMKLKKCIKNKQIGMVVMDGLQNLLVKQKHSHRQGPQELQSIWKIRIYISSPSKAMHEVQMVIIWKLRRD